MSAPIEAEGLVRRFGEAIVAVDGVDLVVEQGEVFGFLGPNGAGKSTTVRMLTTLLMPTEGTARVAGHDVVKEAKLVRQSIGVALQDAAIDPLMTGNELLLLQGVLHGLPKAEAKSRGGTLLERVRNTALDAFSHEEVPFDRVVDALGLERDASRTPLFQTMLVLAASHGAG